MTVRLVPCLVELRNEFNTLFPLRDKESDGWIGDAAHQKEHSDHNADSRDLVHAIDVDDDLGSGGNMQDFVDHLVARRDPRLTYIIFDRVIWSASHDWIPRPYTGSDPHTGHAHISADNTPAHENDISSYRLEDVMTVQDDVWNYDVNPTEGASNTAHGTLWTLFVRTPTNLASIMPTLSGLASTLSAMKIQLDQLAADNAALKAAMDLLTADPASGNSVIVNAVRFVLANPDTPTSAPTTRRRE